MLHLPDGPFDAYIFDCDGTLVDSMPLHLEAWRASLALHGFAPDDFTLEMHHAYAGMPGVAIVADLNERFGTGLDPAAVEADKVRWYLAHHHTVQAIEPVVAGHRRRPRRRHAMGFRPGRTFRRAPEPMKISYPADLPISARRSEITAAIREHQVVVIAGETGSGKTTQLPKMCLEAGLAIKGRIGCTQPRRVAAMSISRRVAAELEVPWGREVGCRMRFSDDTSRDTVLKFMTDGILLAEIQSDRDLRAYSAIIIDEAHERSLNIDFLLGYLKGLLARRRDLKLIITSATIDTAAFSAAFGGAPVIEVSGRTWPVDIHYAPPEESEGEGGWMRAALTAVDDAATSTDEGDILVFLPTERDIREAVDVLGGRLGPSWEVLPLYGRMAGQDQQRVFGSSSRRRVIAATNIAETSLTIPGIGCVIDTGLSRISRYQPRTRTRRLPIEPVAQSSANQRAGRAGRVKAGLCIRLYSEEDFLKRPLFAVPEIQRANLAEVILRMKAFRLGEIESFEL